MDTTENFFDELVGFLDVTDSEKIRLRHRVLPELKSAVIVNPFEIQRRITIYLDMIRAPYRETRLGISVETGGFEGGTLELPDSFYEGPLEILIKMEGDEPEEGFVNYKDFIDSVFDVLGDEGRRLISPLLNKRKLNGRQYSLETIEKFLPELKKKVELILKRRSRYRLDRDVQEFRFRESKVEAVYSNEPSNKGKEIIIDRVYNYLIQGASENYAYRLAKRINYWKPAGGQSFVRRNFPDLSLRKLKTRSILHPTMSMLLEKIVLSAAQKGLSVPQASKFAFTTPVSVRIIYYAAEIDFFTEDEKEVMDGLIARGRSVMPSTFSYGNIPINDSDFGYYRKNKGKFSK